MSWRHLSAFYTIKKWMKIRCFGLLTSVGCSKTEPSRSSRLATFRSPWRATTSRSLVFAANRSKCPRSKTPSETSSKVSLSFAESADTPEQFNFYNLFLKLVDCLAKKKFNRNVKLSTSHARQAGLRRRKWSFSSLHWHHQLALAIKLGTLQVIHQSA